MKRNIIAEEYAIEIIEYLTPTPPRGGLFKKQLKSIVSTIKSEDLIDKVNTALIDLINNNLDEFEKGDIDALKYYGFSMQGVNIN